MLRYFRDNASSALLQVGFAVIVVVFIFMGSNPSGNQLEDAAVVNGARITNTDVQRQLQVLVSRQRAMGLEVEQLDPDQLRSSALDNLIEREVLLQTAHEGGYVVSDQELADRIISDRRFADVDGNFDRNAYRRAFGNDQARITEYESDLREALLISRVEELIRSSVHISEQEIRREWERGNLEVELEYVRVATRGMADKVELSDEDVTAWLGENEAQARRYYDDNVDRLYRQPRQVRARHILLKSADDDSEALTAELRTRMESILERARGGEDFADLAREFSEDSSARSGGDLGFFDDRQMVAPFSEAAFALEVGGISEIVETRFGLHVIKVEEIQEASERSFEEVQQEIARQIAGEEQAPELARALAQQIADAFAAGETPDQLLTDNDLALSETGAFKPAEGRFPGLGNGPELLGAAESLTEPGVGPARVFDAPGGFAAIRLVRRTENAEGTFEDGREDIASRLERSKQIAALSAWRDSLRLSADVQVAVR